MDVLRGAVLDEGLARGVRRVVPVRVGDLATQGVDHVGELCYGWGRPLARPWWEVPLVPLATRPGGCVSSRLSRSLLRPVGTGG